MVNVVTFVLWMALIGMELNVNHVVIASSLLPQIWHVKIVLQTVSNVPIIQYVKYVILPISTWLAANALMLVPWMILLGMEIGVSIVPKTSTLMRLNWGVIIVLIIVSNVQMTQFVKSVIHLISTYLMDNVLIVVSKMALIGMEVNVYPACSTNSLMKHPWSVKTALITASNVQVKTFVMLAIHLTIPNLQMAMDPVLMNAYLTTKCGYQLKMLAEIK